MKYFNQLINKWSIAKKVIPLALIVIIFKFIAHKFGFEIMDLNTLFSSLIAGTIFLIGFLITGVLSDYKESEKLPREIAASLQNLFDDSYTVLKTKNSLHDFAIKIKQEEIKDQNQNDA